MECDDFGPNQVEGGHQQIRVGIQHIGLPLIVLACCHLLIQRWHFKILESV